MDANPDQTPPGLNAWLAQDARHAGALLRAQATLALFSPPLQVVPPVEPLPEPPRWRAWLRQWRVPVAGGAALAAAGVAGLLLYDPDAQTYATDVGEMRQVTLAEGSALSLDTQTSLTVDMDRNARVLTLAEGRALMRVRHDPARPFRVEAGPVTITDIGTVFQVIRHGDAVAVLVSEGMVEIRAEGGTMRLSAGQTASFGPQGIPLAQPISPTAIERATAWTSGRIELDGERLDSAIEEMNRHNRLKITLGDKALAAQQLYGAFRLDDPEGFARTAALGVGGTARDDGDRIIISAK